MQLVGTTLNVDIHAGGSFAIISISKFSLPLQDVHSTTRNYVTTSVLIEAEKIGTMCFRFNRTKKKISIKRKRMRKDMCIAGN